MAMAQAHSDQAQAVAFTCVGSLSAAAMGLLAKAGVAACAVGVTHAIVAPGSAPVQPQPPAQLTYSVSDYAVEHDAPAETAQSFLNPLSFGVALGLFVAVVTGRAPAAMAADLENGESIFQGNCTACHAGGNNTVVAEKKLKKEALQQYGKYEVEAIIKQVTNGNGAMPAFGERMGPDGHG